MQYDPVSNSGLDARELSQSRELNQSRDVCFRDEVLTYSNHSDKRQTRREFLFDLDTEEGKITFKRIWEDQDIQNFLDPHMDGQSWTQNYEEISKVASNRADFLPELLAVIRVQRTSRVLAKITQATKFKVDQQAFRTSHKSLPTAIGIDYRSLWDSEYCRGLNQYIKPAKEPGVAKAAGISVLPNTQSCLTDVYVLHAMASAMASPHHGKDPAVFESALIQGVFRYQWETVARHFHIDFLLEIIMACLLTAVAISVHSNTVGSARWVRDYGYILTVFFAKDLLESLVICARRAHLSMTREFWVSDHGFACVPRLIIDAGSMCIVYVIRRWTKDDGPKEVNIFRICMIIFVVMRFCRLFSYCQAANIFDFGESSIALTKAIQASIPLALIICFVMVAFGTSYYMLPFPRTVLEEILILYNDGVMGEPSTNVLEDYEPSYAMDANGTMTEQDFVPCAYHKYVVVFYVVFTIVVFLVFVNLLQGVLGDEYKNAKHKYARHAHLRQRAHMTVDLLLKREFFCIHRRSPEAILLIYDEAEEEKEDEDADEADYEMVQQEKHESSMSSSSGANRNASPYSSALRGSAGTHFDNSKGVLTHEGMRHHLPPSPPKDQSGRPPAVNQYHAASAPLIPNTPHQVQRPASKRPHGFYEQSYHIT